MAGGPRGPYSKRSAEEIIKALTDARGLVTIAAKNLGMSRTGVQNRIKTNAAIRQALQDAREATLDVAELSLYNQVVAGEGWAVCFLLKTLGKSRGYVERQDALPDDATRVRRIVIEEIQYGDGAAAEPVDAGQGDAPLSLPLRAGRNVVA